MDHEDGPRDAWLTEDLKMLYISITMWLTNRGTPGLGV